MINDEVDKNDLIDKFYTKYLSKCEARNQIPDLDFAKSFIDKYNLANTAAYKKFQNSIKANNENIDYAIEKYKEQPKAIIIGAMPHSVKNRGDYESLYGKLINDPYGYPKTFNVNFSKSMSISSFERALKEVDYYLRRCKYDEMNEIYKYNQE